MDRMAAAELTTVREFLGLTGEALASALGVRTDTIRRWEYGREPIPVRVGEEIEQLEAYTGRAVAALVDALNSAADAVVIVYRKDEEVRIESVAPWVTARWWRHVVARAVLEVPGVDIAYSTEGATQATGVAALMAAGADRG